MKLNIGDRVKYIGDCWGDSRFNPLWGGGNGNVGGIIIGRDANYYNVKWDNGRENGGYCDKCLVLLSNEKNMQPLSSTLKRILSKPLQSQYKAGYRNGDLKLTEKGKDELLEILATKNETELTASADEELAEEEKKK